MKNQNSRHGMNPFRYGSVNKYFIYVSIEMNKYMLIFFTAKFRVIYTGKS